MTLLETVIHYVTAAREAIAVAERNLAARAWRSSVHEAYYAAFYAATAALATRELDFKRHAGVVGTFNRLFVHEESLFGAETAHRLQLLLEYRLRFDYEPVPGEKDAAEYALAASRAFVGEVLPYVDGWLETAGDKEP
jgi:uncharacterized protein (UPF0332 family)